MSAVLSELHFLPCVGVFQHYAQAETIVLEAHENYQKGSYRNRCHILGANGLQRLSLPLAKGKNNQLNIREVQLSHEQDWPRQHWQSETMSEEILINVTPVETRVAVVENGVLQEVYIERTRSKGIVGNIYQGKVVRVLPGMQAAFVEVGLERTSFIHASDIVALEQEGGEHADIRSKIREGQQLTVQVTKDPMGTKGARLSTRLSVSSRYLVYMPGASHLGVSHRIDDEDERQRLRDLMENILRDGDDDEPLVLTDGYILRTAAEGAGEDELRADVAFLRRLWLAVERRMKRDTAPSVIYEDLPLFMRTMRDLVHPGLEKIRIDSRESFQRVDEFAKDYLPEIRSKLEYYPGERPIFDLYSVEDEIQRALGRKVELKSGGYLIIDQTEAMTTIDINTGAFVGHRNLEETIFKTNLNSFLIMR